MHPDQRWETIGVITWPCAGTDAARLISNPILLALGLHTVILRAPPASYWTRLAPFLSSSHGLRADASSPVSVTPRVLLGRPHTPLDPGWPRVRLQAYKVIEQCRIVAFSVNVCYLRRDGFIGPAVCLSRLAAASRVKSAW